MNTTKKTASLMLISTLTKPINFLKEIIIAAIFGAGTARDAFLIAWQVPNVVGSFVFEGLPQIFIPWLADIRNKKDYSIILSTILNIFFIIFTIFSFVLYFGSSYWIKLIAPFISKDTFILSSSLLKIMSFSVLSMGFSTILTGLLYSYGNFIIPTIIVPIMNVVIIAAVLIGASIWGIYSLATGVIIGSFAMVFIQLINLRKIKYSFNFQMDDNIKILLLLSGSFLIGTFLFNLAAIVEKIFASTLPTGNISYLDYAFRIFQLTYSLFLPITIVIFPKLCETLNSDHFSNLITKGLKTIIFLVIPVSIVLFFFQLPITKIIYQRGAFTEHNTISTSYLMGIYSLGLIPHSLNYLLIHVFYATKSMNARIKYSALYLVSTVFFNFLLINKYGAAGIAASNSLAALICTFFLVYSVKMKIQIKVSEILFSFLNIAFISIISVYCAKYVYMFISYSLNSLLSLSISLIIFFLLYLSLMYLFKVPELKYFKDLIPEFTSRFKKK
ncbi:MAG: hypothetical protein A2252_08365 [Elusimicrobia bacterium RIFOXYA2_FULL_39_19]|nr:MAG: hypothetical protein A2252_08365 [Elusimicrobia bacterium RIFOXYA2_FULL_39_19]